MQITIAGPSKEGMQTNLEIILLCASDNLVIYVLSIQDYLVFTVALLDFYEKVFFFSDRL